MEIDLRKFIEENKITTKTHEKLKSDIFKEIVNYLDNNPKYIIDHSNDPPHDHSGQLLRLSDHFILSVYERVGDFMQEYGGSKMPSFSSGCGWYYPRIDDEIYDGAIGNGQIFANYYVDLLIKKHDLDKDDWGDYLDDVWGILRGENFKLSDEIFNAKLVEVYNECSKSKDLLSRDNSFLRNDIIKIISNYDGNSEIMLFVFNEDALLVNCSYKLSNVKDRDEHADDPDSDYKIFHYQMNNAINNHFLIVLTLQKMHDNNKFEIRSLRVHDRTITKIPTDELRECYSICADCGERIETPQNYIFSEFK